MLAFRILYEDEFMVAVDKPAGFHTHPPEEESIRISPRWNGLRIAEHQLGIPLYPVHRLDRATSGVLLFSKAREHNRALQMQFAEQKVHKKYALLARGKIPITTEYEDPLKRKDGSLLPAATGVEPVFSFAVVLPSVTAPGEVTSRQFTLAWAYPRTGRFHQIRRHCAHASHPIVGDTQHGDRKLNRAFTAVTELDRLFLRNMELRLRHPVTEAELAIRAVWNRDWHRLFEIAGFCPITA